MRMAAIGCAALALTACLGGQAASAGDNAPAAQMSAASAAATDISAQSRRRPPTRLRVYPTFRYGRGDPDIVPRYFPGPNAVRDCTAHYVQEYRPSGTVITPRMHCVWRPG